MEVNMGTVAGADGAEEASPRFKARMAGVFYLLAGGTSAFGEFIVVGGQVVLGNAAATAHNTLASVARSSL
jgi:hypothetical protein